MKCCNRKSAYRHVFGWGGVVCGMLGIATSVAGAQMHKVEAPQKVTRAVGVYEWTGDLKKPTAARLVPVTLFIEGHFEDAGVYLSRPAPFALQTGIAYEVDQAGKALGTLNLDYAKDIVTRRSATDDNPVSAWYGYGTFVLPSVTPPSHLHASNDLPVITGSGHDAVNSDDDGKPHLARRAGSESTPAATAPSGSTPSTSAPTPTPTTGAEDPDRPTLRHRDPADTAKPKKHDDGGEVIPLNKSLNDDPNRPIMRRGMPLGEVSVAPLTGVPADLHQAVAVSDAVTHDEHIFERAWDSDSERVKTLAELEALAQTRIQSYIVTNRLSLTDPTAQQPAQPKQVPGRPHSNIRIPTQSKLMMNAGPVPLANEDLKGYELTYGGLPTFVYTVETPLFSGGPVYLTLVAQRVTAGNLQVAFASITDGAHLDRTPWFRFVDAVDPDGSHRASLLFELRGQSSRQFALYRLITANAEQLFATGIIE